MNVTCSICGKLIETKKEDVKVTVGWLLEGIANDNKISHEDRFPRVSMVCKNCWEKKLKNKPSTIDYYWSYNKEI